MTTEEFDKLITIRNEQTTLREEFRKLENEASESFITKVTVDDYFKRKHSDEVVSYYKILEIERGRVTTKRIYDRENSYSIEIYNINEYSVSDFIENLELSNEEEFNDAQNKVLNKLS